MYSYEKRKKAVELYIKFDKSASAVVRELGYPDYHSLRKWYEEYQATGTADKADSNPYGYSYEQRKAAVEYYKGHGRNLRGTCRKLGYPAYSKLSEWVTAGLPSDCHPLPEGKNVANYTITQKQHAVASLALGTGNAKNLENEMQTKSNY
ncbi:MAG: transposase [Sphaerochaetaceae bacterium]|jgi:hypothetical protein